MYIIYYVLGNITSLLVSIVMSTTSIDNTDQQVNGFSNTQHTTHLS